MKKQNIFKLLLLFLVTSTAFAQVQKAQTLQLGDTSTNSQDGSAALQIDDTTRGILIPRMTIAQRTAISSPAAGLLVYQTEAPIGFYYYNGTTWGQISGSSKFVDGTTATNAVYTAGSVGIGTTTPDANAILDVTSTNKGILIPRVQLTSTLSSAPLTAFTPGMVVYNIGNGGSGQTAVAQGFYVSDAVSWSRLTLNYGNRGDINLNGDNQNPVFTILAGAVSSTKLATSLKIGGGTPATTSVALEVAGGTKGFVVSTTSNISSITNPIEGMMVYSTTENCLRVYTSTGWSNCFQTVAGNPSSNSSGTVSAYAAGVNKSVTPIFGKMVTGLTTTSSATVENTGGYNIIASSATLPGIIFISTGTFSATGANTVTLTAQGVINDGYAGTHTFTSNTTPSFTFTLTIGTMNYVTANGSTFNAFYNGQVNNAYTGTSTTVFHTSGEAFSTVPDCVSKTISQTTVANCPASVTGTSGTVYPLVLINGQCWMKTNLNEIPTAFPTGNTNSVWTSTSNTVDSGYWGYINTAVPDGSAGWATSEAGTNYGLVYQFSAAMNNSTTERAQGACPTGFHIPSDCEFMFLEHGLGMSVAKNIEIGSYRPGTTNSGDISFKLRSEGTSSNNASGFSVLLTGIRDWSGVFNNLGTRAQYHTSTIQNGVRPNRVLTSGSSQSLGRFYTSISNGPIPASIRCLKN